MPDIIVRPIQKINKNIRGTVIGFKANEVHGNVTTVNIYTLPPDVDRAALWDALLEKKKRKPYKFTEPYTAYDEKVFKGRSEEIERVLDTIARQQQVVIYGQAGVGKTSLVAAGLIPQLLKLGVLTIQIQDYADPVNAIRAAFKANNEDIDIELPENISLPQLVDAITEATDGTLFLIFDQFELLFDASIDNDRRETFVAALQELLNAQPPKPLRFIILVREDVMGKMAEMQTRLPELLKCPFMLLPLTFEKAIEAIKGPLKATDYPVSFAPDSLVEERVVPDLVEVSKSAEGSKRAAGGVNPPYLQIVCSWLYEQARLLDPPQINADLYGQGAESIIARYLQDLLSTQLKDIQAEATEVLTLMASPGTEHWIFVKQLQLKGVPPDEMETKVTQVLKRLMDTKLVIMRTEEGKSSYALANPTLEEMALKLGGDDAASRHQSGKELERLWATWLSRNILASREQLRYLAESGTHLTPHALQALFLLRSAAEREEPTSLWLDWIKADKERAFIWQLEGRKVPEGLKPTSLTTVKNAGLLLDLKTNGAKASPSVDDDDAFGEIAESAVTHTNAAIRQTLALVLTVFGRHKALSQLNYALQEKLSGGRRLKWRQAELLGTMADADPKIEEINLDLPRQQRFLIWLWRAMRRVRRDRRRLFWFAVGGAVGAGAGMGLLRGGITFLIDIANNATPNMVYTNTGIQLGAAFYYAAIVGALTGFGIALAKPLLAPRAQEKIQTTEPPGTARRGALLAVFTGALFFGLGHILIMPMNGMVFSETPLSLPLGFVAGLGLCLAVYFHPRAGARLRIGKWLLGLVVAVLTFVLIQIAFNLSTGIQTGTAFSWLSSKYERSFENSGLRVVQSLMESLPCRSPDGSVEFYPCWADYLTLIDAALIGVVLFIGITFGLALARKYLSKHRVEAEYLGE